MIRSELLAEGVSATHPKARFVGLQAYEDAGGVVERDLFAQEDADRIHLLDLELLDRLALEKLQKAADELDGWKWVEPMLELPWDALHRLGRMEGRAVPATPEEEAELKALEEKLDNIRRQLADVDAEATQAEQKAEEENGNTDAVLSSFEEREEELRNEETATYQLSEQLQGEIRRRREYTDFEKAHSGCIVTLDEHNGDVQVHAGLVRPGDEPKPEEVAPEAAGAQGGRRDGRRAAGRGRGRRRSRRHRLHAAGAQPAGAEPAAGGPQRRGAEQRVRRGAEPHPRRADQARAGSAVRPRAAAVHVPGLPEHRNPVLRGSQRAELQRQRDDQHPVRREGRQGVREGVAGDRPAHRAAQGAAETSG